MKRRGRNRRHQSSSGRSQKRYSRATAVVFNAKKEVLLVRHNKQTEWALPGGRIRSGEDHAARAVTEVAEETGIIITQPRFIGRYAGSVASHEIYSAQGEGVPSPEHSEVQEVAWWDGKSPSIRVQRHVNAILAITRNEQARLGNESSMQLRRLWDDNKLMIIGVGLLLLIAFSVAYALF